MRCASILSVVFSLAVVCTADDPGSGIAPAEVSTGNPKVVYVAAIGTTPGSPIQGSVTAQQGSGGIGVKYTVQLSGLTKDAPLPYLYHVHAKAIPQGGKCADTAAHLTQGPTALNWNCNLKYASNDYTNKLDLCEVGQLSGKYGNITAEKIGADSSFALEFTDQYSSLKLGDKFFIGDKSVVIHNGKNDRLTCANFEKSG